MRTDLVTGITGVGIQAHDPSKMARRWGEVLAQPPRRAEGAEVVALAPDAPPDAATRRFPPLIVLGAPDDCRLMREEIFGPILPVVAYAGLDEALAYVNARPLSRPAGASRWRPAPLARAAS